MSAFKAPWRLTNGDDEVGIDYASPGYYDNLHIVNTDNDLVVGCDEYDVFSGESNRAYVIKLLLAAPELYEALDRLIKCYSVSSGREARESCWKQARAALLKASPDNKGSL